jgi:hypothetical protein
MRHMHIITICYRLAMQVKKRLVGKDKRRVQETSSTKVFIQERAEVVQSEN